MEFRWSDESGVWILVPSRDDGWRLTVSKVDDVFWSIFVVDRPLQGRYTSEQGAKLDAWEFVKSKSGALFGDRQVTLRE